MLLVQVAQCDAVVVESRADFGQIAGFVQRAVRHGSCAIQPIVVAAAAFVGVVFGIAAGQQIIKLTRFAKQRQAKVMAVIGCVAGVHFGTEIRIAAVFQQIGGIQRFGDNRAVGLPDTGRRAACTFLHGDNFHHGRVEHVAALVVVDLAVCISIVHFHINRVLPHAADIQERRRAVTAAEADGRFLFQHITQFGIGRFVHFAGGDTAGGRIAAHINALQLLGFLRLRRVFCMCHGAGQ